MVRVALRRPLLLATPLLYLSACGGGGSSPPPPPPPPPPPAAQTISFATAGAIDKIVGDAPFTNTASGGAGTGAITYSSSNTAVATVGADSGTVTVIAAGSTVITASKAASTGFLAASATYTVNVAAAPPPPPVAQTISFATAGPIDKFVGDAPFTNTASGGAGTGAITYSSSNLAVATVDADSGTVTLIAAGSTVITANKVASIGFLAASATYTVNVAAPVGQFIAFSGPGPITRTFGDPQFTNTAAGGFGTGAFTYSSDTPAVATVDVNTSLVTIVGAGTAHITASKAASPGFLAASTSYTLNVLRAAQTLTFHYTGPLSKRPWDSPMINPARGGTGTGAVTYTSSDPSVVTVVASTGEVRFVTTGPTTITANKAQSANHLAASATYLINVHSPDIDELVALIGDADTEAQFPATAVGAQFMRSGLAGCSLNNFESCPLAPVSTLASANVLDSETSTFFDSVYALRRNGFTTRPTLTDGFGYYPTYDNEVVEENGTLWSLNFNLGVISRSNDGRAWMNSSAPVPFEAREGAAATGHDNKIWVVGGNQLQATGPGSTLGEKADVFVIDTQGGSGFVTTNAAFGPRKYHRVISFNGRLWLVGGQRGATPEYLNDVWSTADGSTWTLAIAAAPFAPRAEHALAVFNGRLWVVQGRNGSGYLQDVWSTADGVTWRAENQFGNFGRAGHRAVVHNGRLYVMGQAEFLDFYAYSTADGVSWQTHDAGGAPQLHRAAVVSFKSRLWIFGGKVLLNEACCARGDVWSSSDLAEWRFESLGAPYSSMPGARMVEFNGELFLSASSSWQSTLLHKPYKTSDGIHWSEAEPPLEIMQQANALSESPLLTFNNRLWILGGRNLEPYRFNSPRAEVFSTDDGSTWTRHNDNAFLPRYGHSGYAIGGRMFVLGGYNDLTQQLGDIHSSVNGVQWNEDVATVTNIGRRSYHETVVFNNRVWLLGGEKDGTSVTSQIWSSGDGVTWQLESADQPATARKQFGAVVWNGRIWIVGGKNAAGQLVADVWSSADGVNWRLETQSAIPTPRARMALAVLNNKFYMFGGESTRPDDAGRGINEMWSSADGVTWRRLYRNDVEVP
jgi:uncharacterized protein YjdB